MKVNPFFDREVELQLLCAGADTLMLTLYGEAGIGKSSLLNEAIARLRERSGPTLILKADFSALASIEPANRPQALLRQLIPQMTDAEAMADAGQLSANEAANKLTTYLNQYATQGGLVMVMYDETEKVQEDMEFWKWLEMALISPLVAEGVTHQVLAGRVPAPLKRFENRRVVRLLELEPLPIATDARSLARQIIQETARSPSRRQVECAVDLTLDLSQGHPGLTIELSRHIAGRLTEIKSNQRAAGISVAELRRDLCQSVVKPFIDRFFFADIDETWREILWQVSLLDWFTSTVLQAYLEQVAPTLVEGRNENFFISGISLLRLRNTVVWRTAQGDSVYGVIASIVRRCYQVLWPDRYTAALNAAAETLRALVKEFHLEQPESESYILAADNYAARARQAAP